MGGVVFSSCYFTQCGSKDVMKDALNLQKCNIKENRSLKAIPVVDSLGKTCGPPVQKHCYKVS